MSAVIRCKFRCTAKSERAPYQKGLGADHSEVELSAVMGKDNEPWSKYTPSGLLKISITNPEAVGAIELGREYWIDLTPVETE